MRENQNQFQMVEAVIDTNKLQAMIDVRIDIALKQQRRELFAGLELNQQMSIAYLKKQGYKCSWHSFHRAIENAELPAQMGNRFKVEDLDIWAFQNLKMKKTDTTK